MIEEKVIERIEGILFDFDDPEIRQMLRLVTNLSTNPKAIPSLKVHYHLEFIDYSILITNPLQTNLLVFN